MITLLFSLASPGRRRLAVGSLVVGLGVALAGSTAYALATIGQSHAGGNASVGPAAPSKPGQPGHGMRGQSDNAALDSLLDGTLTKWSAAVGGSSTAASLELATNTPVMAIGGFTGSDPVPTLSEFQQYVSDQQVTYFIAPNDQGHGPGGRGHSDIATWVAAHYAPITVGTDTVYDLTTPAH